MDTAAAEQPHARTAVQTKSGTREMCHGQVYSQPVGDGNPQSISIGRLVDRERETQREREIYKGGRERDIFIIIYICVCTYTHTNRTGSYMRYIDDHKPHAMF